MAACCDLEVDVNGEETFMVDKDIVASYSGTLCKLFGKSRGPKNRLKLVFNDFPGGSHCFELMLRFCYQFGNTQITPSTIAHLHCAAKFMEMKGPIASGPAGNLLDLTEKSLEEMRYWTWSELLVAVKQCQGLFPASESSGVLEKCLDTLVTRLGSSNEASPCPSTSSPDSSGVRFSCDTKSTESSKTVFSKTTWWFEDVLFLTPVLVEMLVKVLLSRRFDQVVISRFVVFYQKSKFHAASSGEKCRVVETVVDLLSVLDQSCVSCKSLFEINRVALNLKIGKSSRNKLESMIGSQLDQATLDNLLVPSPYGTNYLYDVNLVLRFSKAFLQSKQCKVSATRLNKVASLMESYIAEVAPDPYLKPSKFLALIAALPESARNSFDEIYRAIDMYLEVHSGLSEEEKTKICSAMSYEKLSSETCIHLSQNAKFPSKSSIQALMSQQFRLKSLLHSNNTPKSCLESPGRSSEAVNEESGSTTDDQIVLYAGKLDLPSDNKNLRAHLQGMQWRVIELEKVCRKMQIQMAKIMKSRAQQSHTRSLPRLCS